MDADNLGMLIIAASTLAYLYNTGVPSKEPVPGTPDVHDAVDVTRWRHDGTQPFTVRRDTDLFVEPIAAGVFP